MATDQPTSRPCNVCGREFPLTPEFFHRDPKGKLGLCQTCKGCANIRARKWHDANRDRHLGNMRRVAARTRFPGSRKAEYQKGRDHILEYHRRYRQDHAEELRKKQRGYVAANPEKVAEAKRLAHAANRERDNARCRAWAAANPERVKAATAKYRALRREAPGRITEADVILQYERQQGTCFYCSRSLAHRNFHADHYIPLSRGGSNEPTNMVLACPSCNRAKRNKMPSEFQPERGLDGAETRTRRRR